MTTQQLIDALKAGKRLRYKQPNDSPGQFCIIEPYDSDFQYKGGLGFHFYGWGSAYWKNSNVFEFICLYPERFEIGEVIKDIELQENPLPV